MTLLLFLSTPLVALAANTGGAVKDPPDVPFSNSYVGFDIGSGTVLASGAYVTVDSGTYNRVYGAVEEERSNRRSGRQ